MNFLPPLSLAPSVTVARASLSTQPLLIPQIFEEQFAIARKSRPQNAQEVLMRLDSKNKEAQARSLQPEREAGKEIYLTARDFTVGNDLEHSILQFLKQSVSCKEDSLICVDRERVHKRESVFLTEQYAVKVFPHAEDYLDKIAAEISGLDIIKKLNLEEGRSIAFIAVGRCVINNVDNFLLLMHRAPGNTIKYFLDQIFKVPHRLSALNECKAVLSQFGRLLGEMHSKKAIPHPGNASGVSDITFGKLVLEIKRYINEYQKAGGEDFAVIVKFFEEVITNYDTKIYYFTPSHNDTHLENFLFDQKAGMTLIDTARVHYSINASGEPLLASYLHDVGRAEDDIAKWVLYHESNANLILELQEAFRKGYREKAGKLINPSQLFADKAWTMLTRLKSVIQKRFHDEPSRRIYEYYSNFFKNHKFNATF